MLFEVEYFISIVVVHRGGVEPMLNYALNKDNHLLYLCFATLALDTNVMRSI